MLILKELHAENWKSWADLHLTDLDTQGLTLIQGENGSGKSSIRMLIEYLLLDTMCDEFEVGDLPRDTNTECTISCKIARDDDDIEIIKYRNHKEHGNKTILKVNGNDQLTHTDRRVTQKNIEMLLDISSETLFASTVFSSESPSFPESKESVRKQILYKILSLEKYNNYLQKAKDYLSELNAKVNNNLSKLEHSDEKIIILSSELNEATENKNTWEENQNSKKELILNELNELGFIETKTLTDEIKELELNIQKVDKEKYLKLEEDYRELEKEITTLKIKYDIIQNDAKSSIDSVCPVLNISCKELLQNNETIELNIDIETKKLDEKIEILKRKQGILVKEIRELSDIISENNKTEERIDERDKELRDINFSNLRSKDNEKHLNKRLKDIDEEENIYETLVKNIKQELENEEEVKRLTLIENIELNEQLKYYEFWKVGYSTKGIPHLKSEAFIESLEIETNKILSTISSELVEIISQKELASGDIKEAITYKLHSPDKNIKNFKAYSSGQRQRVLIADKLSFHKLLSKFNFILFDEVLELSLDEKGKSSVLDLLKTYSKELGSMFVISHDSEIKEKFDNVINIELKNGVSHIKGDN